MVCLRTHLPRYCQTSLTVLPCYTLVFVLHFSVAYERLCCFCFFIFCSPRSKSGPLFKMHALSQSSICTLFEETSREYGCVFLFEGALLAVVLKGDQQDATPVWANSWDKPESLA